MRHLLSLAGFTQAGQCGFPKVNPEMVGGLQMMRQFFQMSAVQMDDAPAGFAPEQETGVPALRMGTILEQGALLGADPMDPACGLQLFQLTVDGGKTYRMAGLPQVGGQIRGGQSLFRPLLQTVENGLLLFGGIYHKKPR
jgi:hypothetical protein